MIKQKKKLDINAIGCHNFTSQCWKKIYIYDLIHEYTKSKLCNNEILFNAVSFNVKGLGVVY